MSEKFSSLGSASKFLVAPDIESNAGGAAGAPRSSSWASIETYCSRGIVYLRLRA